jgi:hypothetical protein
MGNSQNKEDFSRTQAGRHTTGTFPVSKKVIHKEKMLPEIIKEIFPQDNKLRNTLTFGQKVPRLTLDEGRTISNPRGSIEYELNIKSAENLRKSYMAKLISKNIWQPVNEKKRHNNIIIFDWDDTLLPTSFLTPNGVFIDDSGIDDIDLEKVKRLENNVFNILDKAIKKADTYIITNAAPGWVEYSIKKFYPKITRLLSEITIVSARGQFEKLHPGDSRQWKIQAFLDMLKTMDIDLVTNLICLGDSIIEMEAAHILASKFTHAYIKTVKFRESPMPEELYKQLGLVMEQFDKIFSSIKNLTIKVDKKK